VLLSRYRFPVALIADLRRRLRESA
jgi:hypothetical protein